MGHRGIDTGALRAWLSRLDRRFPLEAAWVVGSRARGDELLDSDYDIVLVSPAFAALPWLERLAAVEADWDLGVGLHAFPYDPAEFARKRAELGSIAAAMRDAAPVWPPHRP